MTDKRFHLALATRDVAACVSDYSARFGCAPAVVVPGEYALWRTATLNVSVRQDSSCAAGELRHLGWEDPTAEAFTSDTDVNGVVWERFDGALQAAEIERAWPGTGYRPQDGD